MVAAMLAPRARKCLSRAHRSLFGGYIKPCGEWARLGSVLELSRTNNTQLTGSFGITGRH